jgi:hypothetical protein
VAKLKRPTYEEWLKELNSLTLATYYMSIYELEDDIPREQLRKAYESGESSRIFVEKRVTPIFYPEERA